MAREDLSNDPNVPRLVADANGCGVEIELAPILADCLFVIEREAQITQRLIGLQARGPPHHPTLGECVRLLRRAREQQPPHFRQMLQRVRVVALLPPTHPERVLVQLDALAVHATEDHRPQPPIPDRHRMIPLRRRLPVPKEG